MADDGSTRSNASANDAGSGVEDEASGQDSDDEHTLRCLVCSSPLIQTGVYQTALDCDGGCERSMPKTERHFICAACSDFDMCLKCAGVTASCPACSKPLSHTATSVWQELCGGECGRTLPPAESRFVCQKHTFHMCFRCAGADCRRAPVIAESLVGGNSTSAPPSPLSTPTTAAPAAASTAVSTAVPDTTAAQPATAAPSAVPTVAGLSFRQGPPPRENPFRQWQAQRAAERASESSASPAPSETTARPTPGPPHASPVQRMPPQTTVHELPATSSPQRSLEAHVAMLLSDGDASRHRTLQFAREVFRQVPSDALAIAGDRLFGEQSPDMVRNSSGESPVERAPQQFQVELYRAPVVGVTERRRCFCCDVTVGSGDVALCSALQLYDTLRDDMLARDQIIESESEAEDANLACLHKSARWFMYRTFVRAQYGHLGRGVRVRIPDCVLIAIRSRYPSPECDCDVGQLATCTTHGYTGHRDV